MSCSVTNAKKPSSHDIGRAIGVLVAAGAAHEGSAELLRLVDKASRRCDVCGSRIQQLMVQVTAVETWINPRTCVHCEYPRCDVLCSAPDVACGILRRAQAILVWANDDMSCLHAIERIARIVPASATMCSLSIRIFNPPTSHSPGFDKEQSVWPEIFERVEALWPRLRRMQCIGNIPIAGIAGMQRLRHLEHVVLPHSSVASASPLAGCGGIKSIAVPCSPVDDAGIEGLGVLRRLEVLDLSFTRVTSVSHLAECESLRSLDLSSTPVVDAGIVGLDSLRFLQDMCLNFTHVSCVAHLASCSMLKKLSLLKTNVDNAGIAGLGRLKRLEVLDLSYTAVSSVTHLTGCEALQRLELTGTNVDDAGIVGLERLRHLERLALISTLVTSVAQFSTCKPLLFTRSGQHR